MRRMRAALEAGRQAAPSSFATAIPVCHACRPCRLLILPLVDLLRGFPHGRATQV